MGSPAAATSFASPRRLPTAVLLLLAALGVALGPAVGGDGGSAPSAALPSTYPAVHVRDAAAGTVPAPARAVLRHAPAASSAVDRPAFDATLPAVVVLALLLALVGRDGADEGARALASSGGSARGPPASPA